MHGVQGTEQLYRTFIETMNEGAVTLLLDGTITFSNRSFAQMLGTPLEPLIGGHLASFVAPGHRDRFQHLIGQARASRCTEVVPLVTGNGATLWVEL